MIHNLRKKVKKFDCQKSRFKDLEIEFKLYFQVTFVMLLPHQLFDFGSFPGIWKITKKKHQNYEFCVGETLFSEAWIWCNICRIWMKSGWLRRWISVVFKCFPVTLVRIQLSSFQQIFRFQEICWNSEISENSEISIKITLFSKNRIQSNIRRIYMKSRWWERWNPEVFEEVHGVFARRFAPSKNRV